MSTGFILTEHAHSNCYSVFCIDRSSLVSLQRVGIIHAYTHSEEEEFDCHCNLSLRQCQYVQCNEKFTTT